MSNHYSKAKCPDCGANILCLDMGIAGYLNSCNFCGRVFSDEELKKLEEGKNGKN